MERRIPERAKAIVLLLLPLALACDPPPPEDEMTAMSTDTLSYLALGDSYTIGEAVDSVQRWPVLLAKGLAAEGLNLQEPVIVARTGWTTDELALGIEESGIEGTYDLVTLLIGVNNQYRGRDPEDYRGEFKGLLSRATAFAGGEPGRVLVLSIPDWGVTPFARDRDPGRIAGEIDAFNAVNRMETLAVGARYLDVTGISREAEEDPDLVAADGLHPSGAMYARWAEEALPLALEALGLRHSG